jgi:hypothetical protein
MHPPLERRSLRALLLGAALGATACSDATLPPRGGAAAHPAGIRFSATASEGKPQRYPNSRKYADTGHRPATGRSGSARLATRMLLYPAGITRMELTTGSFDGTTPASGTLNRVQLKLYDLEGGHITTANFNHVSSSTLELSSGALARRMTVQVQANVVGADPNRNDVVTVRDSVWLAPDLTVSEITLPGQALRGTLVSISATASELNGDVGARADCVLYVNGNATDRAIGVWIDAGDAVACFFTHRFETLGVHTVHVQLENVTPVDWNPGDNQASATLEVISPSGSNDTIRIYGDAHAEHGRYSYWSRWAIRLHYADGSGYEIESHDEYDGEWQTAIAWGWSDVISFPLERLRASQWSLDVIDIQEHTSVSPDWVHEDEWWTEECLSRGTRGWLYVCSYRDPQFGWGWSSTAYMVGAYSVSYYSTGFSRWWYADETSGHTWSYHGSYGGGEFFEIGDEYHFRIEILDALHRTFLLDERVQVGEWQSESYVYPWLCQQHDPWWDEIVLEEWCYGSEGTFWRRGSDGWW